MRRLSVPLCLYSLSLVSSPISLSVCATAVLVLHARSSSSRGSRSTLSCGVGLLRRALACSCRAFSARRSSSRAQARLTLLADGGCENGETPRTRRCRARSLFLSLFLLTAASLELCAMSCEYSFSPSRRPQPPAGGSSTSSRLVRSAPAPPRPSSGRLLRSPLLAPPADPQAPPHAYGGQGYYGPPQGMPPMGYQQVRPLSSARRLGIAQRAAS